MPDSPEDLVSVRYIADDMQAAIDFYTTHLGFTLQLSAVPAFAALIRGRLRLVLSGAGSSGAQSMPDGRMPRPGGWNRILLTTQDINAEVERLQAAGLKFRGEILVGVGGSQILLDDPCGNPVELFQPAPFPAASPPDTTQG
jgi:predicted enzyme related to lactoylglutathione lyase